MGQPLIERLTSQLGGNREKAIAILRDRGHVKQESEELTAEGKRRDAMGASGRAIDRASKTSGRPASDYKYDPRTNRATLKGKR